MRKSVLAQKRIDPTQGPAIRPLTSTPLKVDLLNGKLVAYDDNMNNYIVKGWNINDTIYSIVNLICDKIRVSKWGVYTVQDETAYKQLRIIQAKKELNGADYVKALSLHSKALKPATNAGRWGELTQWANEDQMYGDHVADLIAFRLLTGNSYQYANVLKGGANAGTPYELDYLPAQWVTILSNDKFPARAIGYYNTVAPDLRYTSDQVMHQKDFNPNWDVNGIQLYGMSRVRAALMRLKKSNSLLRAEAATFQNEGIKGLMYIDADPGVMEQEQSTPALNKLKQQVVGEWSGERNRGKIGVASQRMGYIPIGMTGEEMQMVESGMFDLRYFCNLFGGVPSQLLNDPENKVYSNSKEGEKALTSRCCLPHMVAHRERQTKKARESWGLGATQVIDFDMTCYPELSADLNETMDYLSKQIVRIPSEEREMTGQAALQDPVFAEPWVLVAGQWMPYSEMQANQVDNALNEESNTDNSGKAGDS